MKTQLSEIDVEAEAVPFSFELKKGGRELWPSPMGYVSDFKSLVFHLLEENDRFDSYCQYSVCTSLIEMHLHRLSMLEWHNGTIPFDQDRWRQGWIIIQNISSDGKCDEAKLSEEQCCVLDV